jgi:NADH-quinone oxidoreductase subunit E
MLAEKYGPQIESILAKYPAAQKRSAVMPLLYLAQSEYGYVTPEAMEEVGQLVGLTATEVSGIVGFYSLYYDHAAGKRRMQICTDLPCALRGAEEWASQVCARLGVKMHGTTADGEWTVEPVMCLAACDKAPMFQVQDENGIHYHEGPSAAEPLTVDQALEILNRYTRAPSANGKTG